MSEREKVEYTEFFPATGWIAVAYDDSSGALDRIPLVCWTLREGRIAGVCLDADDPRLFMFAEDHPWFLGYAPPEVWDSSYWGRLARAAREAKAARQDR